MIPRSGSARRRGSAIIVPVRMGRFDPSTARVVTDFGSDFLLSAVIAPGATNVCVRVAHLGSGGRIGRHAAIAAQVFCVVAGSGWVSGDDGERVAIATGQAAYWSEGESHAAGTEAGLTAVVVEGTFQFVAQSLQ
jgi:hypothetical protein